MPDFHRRRMLSDSHLSKSIRETSGSPQGVLILHVLSVGPAMSVSQFQLNYDHPSTGPWDTTAVRILFPLQAASIKNATVAGAPNGDYLVCDLVADYTAD